jgi:putative transposase
MQSDSSRQAELVICDKTIERSLAWLSRPRRLAKDYEELPECAEAHVYVASITLLLNRLVPSRY